VFVNRKTCRKQSGKIFPVEIFPYRP